MICCKDPRHLKLVGKSEAKTVADGRIQSALVLVEQCMACGNELYSVQPTDSHSCIVLPEGAMAPRWRAMLTGTNFQWRQLHRRELGATLEAP